MVNRYIGKKRGGTELDNKYKRYVAQERLRIVLDKKKELTDQLDGLYEATVSNEVYRKLDEAFNEVVKYESKFLSEL